MGIYIGAFLQICESQRWFITKLFNMYKVLAAIISLVVLSQGQETNQTQLTQVTSAVEDALSSGNNYLVLLTEVGTQISKYITMYIQQVQSGNFGLLNFTNVYNESQILSCTSNENTTFISLLNNNTQSLNNCLQNVGPMSTQLLTSLHNLLQDISDTITDISQKINSCNTGDTNIIKLLGCVNNLRKPITDDLRNVTNQLHNTIHVAWEIVPALSNQTSSCVTSTANYFLRTARQILVNYYHCLSN